MNTKACLVPGSLNLLFAFKVSNVKSWFLYNLSKLLQEHLVIEVAHDCSDESHLDEYSDLCKSMRKLTEHHLEMHKWYSMPP